MSRIRGLDTGPELALRRALSRRGLRYRMYDRRLPGRLDLRARAETSGPIPGPSRDGSGRKRWCSCSLAGPNLSCSAIVCLRGCVLSKNSARCPRIKVFGLKFGRHPLKRDRGRNPERRGILRQAEGFFDKKIDPSTIVLRWPLDHGGKSSEGGP